MRDYTIVLVHESGLTKKDAMAKFKDLMEKQPVVYPKVFKGTTDITDQFVQEIEDE